MKAKLIKIKSSHANLRTNEIKGDIDNLPTVGESFYISGKGIEFGTRIITTTSVKNLEKIDDKTFKFNTKNSEYRLEILESIN